MSGRTGLHGWVDARAGVAGDMLAGALVDAGADLGVLQRSVDAVVPATVRLVTTTVRRAGLRATKLDVELVEPDQPHRPWRDLRPLLAGADLPDPVRDAAVDVFSRLVAAEARVHGVDAEDVVLHEVGAWDSVADVVAVCAGLHALGVDRVSAGPVALGSGQVRGAHGLLPVPVPAVLELSRGWSVLAGGTGELTTPTGMALVRALATSCEELPALTPVALGVGAGTRDPQDRPNVVRVVLGAPAGPPDRDVHEAVLLETTVDDVDPRVWPGVLEALLAAGAADVWLTAVTGKKGRPAHVLSVLARPPQVPDLRRRVLDLLPTLGVRESSVRRTALARTWREVALPGGTVRVKLGHEDGRVRVATPEFEDVAALARATGRTVRDVLAEAVAAATAAGLVPGGRVPPDAPA